MLRPVMAIALAGLASPAHAAPLSVLTYNVKGLPWPIASDRPAAFARIAARLRAMRAAGRQPRVVVLQEAFTAEARAIGAAAGYRYRVDGPGAGDRTPWPMSAADRAFERAADPFKGEGLGKFAGSGLQILSDYPVLAVRRMAFPAFACAGFDCLANKGVLLATVAVPGRTPVTVVTTHLNSRKSSGVPDARSLHAYRVQVAALRWFLRTNADPRLPIVFAGDFNIGKAAPRRAALFAGAARWTSQGNDALRSCAGLGRDAREAMRRAKDWQFFRGGALAGIAARAIETPFGRERDGSMLSDHIGYTAHYRLVSAPPVRVATAGRTAPGGRAPRAS